MKRTFEDETELLAAVERSRRATRRSAGVSQQERQARAPRGAETRKRNQRETRLRQLRAEVRESCREWDAVHVGDAAIRKDQSAEMKRRARERSDEAREQGDLKPWMIEWAGDNPDGSPAFETWCERCRQRTRKWEAHHTDYSQPLEVVWLCLLRHAAIHRAELAEDVWLHLFGERLADADGRIPLAKIELRAVTVGSDTLDPIRSGR